MRGSARGGQGAAPPPRHAVIVRGPCDVPRPSAWLAEVLPACLWGVGWGGKESEYSIRLALAHSDSIHKNGPTALVHVLVTRRVGARRGHVTGQGGGVVGGRGGFLVGFVSRARTFGGGVGRSEARPWWVTPGAPPRLSSPPAAHHRPRTQGTHRPLAVLVMCKHVPALWLGGRVMGVVEFGGAHGAPRMRATWEPPKPPSPTSFKREGGLCHPQGARYRRHGVLGKPGTKG